MLTQHIPAKADWVFHDPIEMIQTLGSGAFATVYKASWKGALVAAKKLLDSFFNPDVVPVDQRMERVTEFVKECTMLAKLRHPNIVQLYGVYIPDDDGQQPPIMLCELMAETLRKRIQRKPRLTFRDVVDLALQIGCGLRFLHERDEPIGHWDLSANNVLLSESGACKISDVGLAKVFTPAAQVSTTMKPGTEPYMPSEVLVSGAQYNEKLDVFSLGVLLLEMLLGHVPQPSCQFSTIEQVGGRETHLPIAETQRRRDELNELGANHPLRPLIVRLLQPQASRPAIAEVYQELKRLMLTDQCQHSPSTFSHGGSGVNPSDIHSMAKSVNELSQQQAELLQQVVTVPQLQVAMQQVTTTMEQQQAATQQQLQQGLDRFQESVQRSLGQHMSALALQKKPVTTQAQEELEELAAEHQDTVMPTEEETDPFHLIGPDRPSWVLVIDLGYDERDARDRYGNWK